MKIIYNGYSEVGGVYKIINLFNKRIYIGSTSCFRKRFRGHFSRLEVGDHKNTFLQNDFNKCGTDAFLFEVVEVVEGSKQARLTREQIFLDQHYDEQKQCYNLVKEARDSRGGTRNKKIIDRSTDKRCHSPLPEVQAKRAIRIREGKNTPEAKEKARQNCKNILWAGHSAGITLVNLATGKEEEVTGSLREWCLSHNVSYKAMHLHKQGKTKSSGGWYLKGKTPVYTSQKGQVRKPLTKEHRAKIAGTKFCDAKVIHTLTGEVVNLPVNIKEFCKENELCYSTFLKVLKGSCKTCGGWTTVK